MIDPLTIRVRQEQSADYQATEALALAAFDPAPRVAELVRRLRASSSLIPELNLVAQVEHTIEGHLMFSRARINNHSQMRRESSHEAASYYGQLKRLRTSEN